jgi:hypothetical protein
VQIRYGLPYRIPPYAVGDQIEPNLEAPEEEVGARLVVLRGTMTPCPACGPKHGDSAYHSSWEPVDVLVEHGTISAVRPHDPRHDFAGDFHDYLVLEQ